MASFAPFSRSFRFLRRSAHESPVVFYSVVLGLIGPVMVLTIPPIRKSLGYLPPERFPTSYPLPNRPRRPVSGYEDD
ncbi:hypothetical protein BS47DRAFT_1298233 [Hydnum rufescens UP504]|uniref:NADH-ubiquinone oxidoreductase 9.5 kDa subunit n=1 Tax=Hydnum rufescens UP504 TaxID=1448309 RepID=A0A9P6AWF1_9AGAM|nr:hypothetical protein BS47DRAFT_1298233 [Hydnum rufescens UP504]